MKIPTLLAKQLKAHSLVPTEIIFEKNLTLEQVQDKYDATILRTVLLEKGVNKILVILPVNEIINFSRLGQFSNQSLNIIPITSCEKYFTHCDPETAPPLTTKLITNTFISYSIKKVDEVIFESGKTGLLIKLSTQDFLKLHPTANITEFTQKPPILDGLYETPDNNNPSNLTPDHDIKASLKRLYKLPPLPDIAMQIIQLKNNPKADARQLADLIQQDPSLTAQVIRYAKSAFYNYKGKISSVHEAISRVLGFDLVMNMALGLSTGKTLKNPPDGPLGLNEFWKHAVYSAILARNLSKKINLQQRPNPNLAYLAGLLHNYGFLVLGHLFQPEFFLLNKLYGANLDKPIVLIEKHALGMGSGQNAIKLGHAELGSWLFESWKLPKEIIIAAREHHNYNYKGEHANYSALIGIVDSALGLHKMGDNRNKDISPLFCKSLNLDPEIVLIELEKVILLEEQIQSLTQQFAA